MRLRIEIPGVLVCPRVADYTKGLELDCNATERAASGAVYRIEHREL